MKQFIVGAGLMLAALSAEAEGHLKAVLQQADSGHPTKLTLTLTNDGDRPVAFERFTTPLQLLDGVHTSYRQFEVVEAGNEDIEAQYRGYFVHNVGHPVESFITLQPGEAKVATYDLAVDYKLKAGVTYKVSFSMALGQGPEDDLGQALPSVLRVAAPQEVISNVLVIGIPVGTDVSGGVREARVGPQPAISDPHQSQLDDAVLYGYNYMANPAWVNYAEGLPPLDSPGTSIHSPQYEKWFGKYANNTTEDRTVTGTLQAVAHRLSQSFSGNALHKIRWVDGCAAGTDPQTVAIAHTGAMDTDHVYEIAVCAKFWTLAARPVKGSPADSQAATIVHEISHFYDLATDTTGWTKPTYDYQGSAYNRAACQKLAVTDRAKAVRSASNYEYYISDVQTRF
ncbi:M35 family metallo-endopeptidase [Luteibacter sp.]|uniref:M35 family metallo-endopeptidase n=1 Tax=Luteibacter sp. TaxID=1886636 RepID=UPI0028077C3B|nr:M35 family metallo-endopeptidase [Luteibacter sp.]MDQ8048089.1 M35 family metallo-endopeptidase [Luteibacter sp.]